MRRRLDAPPAPPIPPRPRFADAADQLQRERARRLALVAFLASVPALLLLSAPHFHFWLSLADAASGRSDAATATNDVGPGHALRTVPAHVEVLSAAGAVFSPIGEDTVQVLVRNMSWTEGPAFARLHSGTCVRVSFVRPSPRQRWPGRGGRPVLQRHAAGRHLRGAGGGVACSRRC